MFQVKSQIYDMNSLKYDVIHWLFYQTVNW